MPLTPRSLLVTYALFALFGCSEAKDAGQAISSFVAQAPTPTATAVTWYDAGPLLESVRPTLHGAVLQAIAPRALNDLPLYDMNLDVDLGSARFTLTQMLWWTQTGPNPEATVAFRIYANTAAALGSKPPPVRLIEGRCPEDAGCKIEQPAVDVIVVTPSQPIASGQRFRIELRIEGSLTRIDSSRTNMLAQGMESMAAMGSPHGHGDYGLLAIGDGVASLANFYPMLAPRRFGRWILGNENLLGDLGSDDLAHVRATVTLDPGVALISGGVIQDRATTDNGRSRVSIVAGAVREIALLASRQLQSASTTVGDVRVTSHYLAADAGEGLRALDVAKHALEIFQKRFGDYPYTELDVVEAAMVGGAGGVEFSGLVTIASMLYRPTNMGSLDALRADMFEFVIAHEVAHQYWHVLVGSDSREHPFNDEALAQHSAVVYLEDRYGQARAKRDENLQVANGYRMMRSMGRPDGAVDRPVAAFGAPIEYAGLIYGKGPMVYRALRDQTGEDGFFEAARKYVKTYRFATAPRRAFIEVIASRGRALQVKDIAHHWLDEAHGDEDLGALDMSTVSGATPGDTANPLLQGGATGAPDLAGMLGMLQGNQPPAGGANDTQSGSGRMGRFTQRPLGGSTMFGNGATFNDNQQGGGPTSDPDMNQLLKTMPGLNPGAAGTPDLSQLLQQMQQLQQPSVPPQ